MNRDTAIAMWYRRIDRHCFVTQTPPEAGNTLARSASPEPTGSEPGGPNRWRALLTVTRVWMPEAAADRL